MYLLLLTIIASPIISGLRIADVDGEMYNNYRMVYPGAIRGPKKFTDRIAIVGAGPSGLHMAYLLREAGFTNVVVLEKTGRLGESFRW